MNKVLIVSYDVNLNMGSEAGKAHLWLLAIAKHYDIDVFVHSKNREEIEAYPCPDNIRFFFNNGNPQTEIGHNLRLEILGDGSERKRVEALVNRYRLEKSVILHGNVPRNEVLQNLKSGDILSSND